MKKLILSLMLLILSIGTTFAYEELQNATAKYVIANAIEDYSNSWYNEELGSIWVALYEDNEDSYSFEITAQNNGLLELDVDFPCGSEYDESELLGSCTINAMIEGDQCIAEVIDCYCE